MAILKELGMRYLPLGQPLFRYCYEHKSLYFLLVEANRVSTLCQHQLASAMIVGESHTKKSNESSIFVWLAMHLLKDF